MVGKAKPGEWREVGLIVIGGIRGLPVSGYLGILPPRSLDASMSQIRRGGLRWLFLATISCQRGQLGAQTVQRAYAERQITVIC